MATLVSTATNRSAGDCFISDQGLPTLLPHPHPASQKLVIFGIGKNLYKAGRSISLHLIHGFSQKSTSTYEEFCMREAVKISHEFPKAPPSLAGFVLGPFGGCIRKHLKREFRVVTDNYG